MAVASQAISYNTETYSATNRLTDVVKLDKAHNAFSRQLWIQFMVRLGLDPEAALVLEMHMHSNNVATPDFVFQLVDQLATGGLPTFSMNTIDCAISSTCYLEWSSPAVLVSTGDDQNLCAAGIEVNLELKKEFESYCNIRFVVVEDDSADYCGMIIAGPLFVPNLYRAFLKLTAYKFPEGDSGWCLFLEYQKTMKDNLQRMMRAGKESVLAAMILNRAAETAYGFQQMSTIEAENVWNCYASWAYATKDIFFKYMKKRVWKIPTLSADGTFDHGICVDSMWKDGFSN